MIKAVFSSDMHWWPTPPVGRSNEPNWTASQMASVRQVLEFASFHNVPWFIAGDLFHHPNPPVGFVNQIIDQFEKFNVRVFAIPGQHDIAYHRKEALSTSGYGNLMRAGVIDHLAYGNAFAIDPTTFVHPFGWGDEIEVTPTVPGFHIALSHRFVWRRNEGYTGAGKVDGAVSVSRFLEKHGYDLGVFGDNHTGFHLGKVWNCGTFMRRNRDEADYAPRFYVLKSDNTMSIEWLDQSKNLPMVENEIVLTVPKISLNVDDIRNAQTEIQYVDYDEFTEQWMKINETAPDVQDRVKLLFDQVRNDG